tara:strand:- start:270 stop:1076 length:807 start_codon:yes stop_codon:yes gene_type:complete
MKTTYTKMNSQGNDFVVIDTSSTDFIESQENIIKISSMNNVSCDQLLLIDTSDINEVKCRIYNNDGSVACQCGNGLRAIMLYLNHKFSINQSTISVCERAYSADIIDEYKISVNLGLPIFSTLSKEILDEFKYLKGSVVDVGNKHIIFQSKKLNSYLTLDEINRILDSDLTRKLLEDYNFTFIQKQILDNKRVLLEIKVRERGAGFTKSCGSGATAAAAYYIMKNKLQERSSIFIQQDGGILEVFSDDDKSLNLIGPSELEYHGAWDG